MKTVKRILVVLIFSIFLLSCTEDDCDIYINIDWQEVPVPTVVENN